MRNRLVLVLVVVLASVIELPAQQQPTETRSPAAIGQSNPDGSPVVPTTSVRRQDTKQTPDVAIEKNAPENKLAMPVLVADGDPLPGTENPPAPPCSCSCFSIFSSFYWNCIFNRGACCANDAPPADDGTVAELTDPTAKEPPPLVAQTWYGPHGNGVSRVTAKKCPVPMDLGDDTVTLAPERVASMVAQLSSLIRPDAVAELSRMLPVGPAPIAITSTLRAEIQAYVLRNLNPAVGRDEGQLQGEEGEM